jgi:ABC-2 type transport system ATP-binding protein
MGMRQRLAIATALLGDPEVLILDEPANGLDPPGIRWMRGLMRAQAERGRAVLVSSHLLSEVAQSVDDVVVIARGELRASGPLEQVLGDANAADGPVTRVRLADGDRLASLLREQGIAVEPDGDGVLLARGVSSDVVGAVAAEHRVPLVELGMQSRSLEDAFFDLTRDHA